MLLAGFTAPADKIKSKSPVHVVSSRMDVFYFKVDKIFLGAELEIYSQDGVKLLSQKVEHRKVLIDFYYENPGKYIILLKKGDVQEQFNFIKEDPCLESDKPTELITVEQGV